MRAQFPAVPAALAVFAVFAVLAALGAGPATAAVTQAGPGPPMAGPARAPAANAADDGAAVLLTMRDRRITESSGLAASGRHAGVLYTHNDSGDQPRIFALGPDGRTLATLTLAGASARDWEAIALGRDTAGRPALFVGDIGDNLGGAWPTVSVYRVTEPATLRNATLPATRYRFRYADGPRDAEALLVDPRTNRLYVASKQDGGAGLYQAPARLRADRVNVLRRVARVPSTVTDGAFAPDGRTFALRDYGSAYIYSAPGKRIATVPLPLQFQAEAITYSRDGADLLDSSEGAGSEVWRVPLPASLRPPLPATGSGAGAGTSGTGAGGTPPVAAPSPPGPGQATSPWLLLVAAAAAALLIRAVRRR